jgi:hypothetical protein
LLTDRKEESVLEFGEETVGREPNDKGPALLQGQHNLSMTSLCREHQSRNAVVRPGVDVGPSLSTGRIRHGEILTLNSKRGQPRVAIRPMKIRGSRVSRLPRMSLRLILQTTSNFSVGTSKLLLFGVVENHNNGLAGVNIERRACGAGIPV